MSNMWSLMMYISDRSKISHCSTCFNTKISQVTAYYQVYFNQGEIHIKRLAIYFIMFIEMYTAEQGQKSFLPKGPIEFIYYKRVGGYLICTKPWLATAYLRAESEKSTAHNKMYMVHAVCSR